MPFIRGECLLAIQRALDKLEEVEEDLIKSGLTTRLMDWLIWAEAIARVYGFKPLEFAKMDQQIVREEEEESILENAKDIQYLLEYLEEQGGYEGTTKDLLEKIKVKVEADKDNLDDKTYQWLMGMDTRTFGIRIGTHKAYLKELGYKVERLRSKRERKIKIYKEEKGDIDDIDDIDFHNSTLDHLLDEPKDLDNNEPNNEDIKENTDQNMQELDEGSDDKGGESMKDYVTYVNYVTSSNTDEANLPNWLEVRQREPYLAVWCNICKELCYPKKDISLDKWAEEHAELFHTKQTE